MLESGTYAGFMFRTSVTLLSKRRLQNRRSELEASRSVFTGRYLLCAISHGLPALATVDNRDGCQVSVAAVQRSATASPQVFHAPFHSCPNTTRPDAAGCLAQRLATPLFVEPPDVLP